MNAARLGSLSLCGSCGRDRDAAAERCVCGATREVWHLMGSAPPGTMIDTRLGQLFFGGLALLIALAIATLNAFAVLAALLIAPTLAVIFFFGGRQWRTEGGAMATTFAGTVVVAEGRGTAAMELLVTGYPRLRGDHAAGALLAGPVEPPRLASNLGEIAVLAALIGAASRGTVVLRTHDVIRWSRVGRTRRLEERTASPSTLLAEATETLAAEEDKLLHDLLAGRVAAAGGASYREAIPTGPGAEDLAPTPLDALLAGVPALGDAESFAARYPSAALTESTRAEQLRELHLASADLALREPVRLLLHEMRRGAPSRVRRALALLR